MKRLNFSLYAAIVLGFLGLIAFIYLFIKVIPLSPDEDPSANVATIINGIVGALWSGASALLFYEALRYQKKELQMTQFQNLHFQLTAEFNKVRNYMYDFDEQIRDSPIESIGKTLSKLLKDKELYQITRVELISLLSNKLRAKYIFFGETFISLMYNCKESEKYFKDLDYNYEENITASLADLEHVILYSYCLLINTKNGHPIIMSASWNERFNNAIIMLKKPEEVESK